MVIRKRSIVQTLLFLILFGSLLTLTQKLNQAFKKPLFSVSNQEKAFNFNEHSLVLASAGNRRLISSLLWINTLLESDIEHYKKKDFNSWMYLRFRSIIAADPSFYEAYLYGGQYLSIIKDDIYGAEDIYDKGLTVYPDDFWLNYHAGFHAYFELAKPSKAIKHYEHILNDPLVRKVIPYLPSLIAKMKAQEGKWEAAFDLLLAGQKKTQDKKLKEKYQESLYALRAQIDLNCLNVLKNKNCRKYDWDGYPYFLGANGQYQSKKPWKPLQIKQK